MKDSHKIQIGNNCRLNDYVFLHGGGGIEIGNDVTLSAFSKIISYRLDTTDWQDMYLKKSMWENKFILEMAHG